MHGRRNCIQRAKLVDIKTSESDVIASSLLAMSKDHGDTTKNYTPKL